MPLRRKRTRSGNISPHDIEALRNALREGWPWRAHDPEKFRNIPLDSRLQIVLSHLTGVFTLPCGFPSDPHPSDETVSNLWSELKTELDQGYKEWGHLVPKRDRWSSKDLRMTTPAWEPRKVY
jgi:hypothetical protein